MDLNPFIRDIPDFPKPGILFKDITPLLANATAFQYAIDLLSIQYANKPIDAIDAPDLDYFRHVCRTPRLREAMRQRVTGSVQRRKRLKPEQLLAVELPIPALVPLVSQ